MLLMKDLLHPSPEEKKKTQTKLLVQSPTPVSGCEMLGCYEITRYWASLVAQWLRV
ncbi:hypothetical protein DBR06_SOUSAS12210013, partial [Sousa chinensis]